jgi:catechol 2,3-dioxygenase-like lactoylglutathione lyase family enzyme
MSGNDPSGAAASGAAIEFGKVTPVLRVRDVAAGVAYYVGTLGFKIDFQFPNVDEPFFASVSRGQCCLFLSAGDQGNAGSWVWIDGKDVDAVYEEYRVSGARIRNPPTNYSWGREMQVEDLDGNILRIGSDQKPGEPEGDWLDMYGDLWRRGPDGGIFRVERA